MKKGFLFDQNKCVECNACRAACILENGWNISPRMVYTFNEETITSYPLVNLSLACNHCEKAVCLEGCPSGSYFRDATTGAIVLNEKKCIGCKYCKWNCPYDAPKYDFQNKIIGKCNLCYRGLIEGRMPACTYACPTGALNFGDFPEQITENIPSWFPDKNLGPAVYFTGKQNINPLKIIPEKNFNSEDVFHHQEKKFKSSLLSLLSFSFLSTLSVSYLISSGIKGQFPDFFLHFSIIILAAISSLFHLGKISRAWRAVINIKTSPLSLEIVSLILYSVLSISGVFFEIPSMLIISSIAGLIFLLSIDNVYNFAGNPKSPILHSGQTFVSALLIISFLSESIIPFVFMAILKTALSIYKALLGKIKDSYSILRTVRVSFLVISASGFLYYNSLNNFVTALFLMGEFIDRILFYIDFDQLNIKTLIIRHLTSLKNEKKRS